MPTLKDIIGANCPDLTKYEALYKKLHANPELSHQERETSSLVAQHLRNLDGGLDIHTEIGGFGLFATLRNGNGATLLLRADMDALPVAERTNLEYASTRKQLDKNGKETPVMHG